MARHSVVILTILFSLFLQHCSKSKSKADNAPRGGEPTDVGPPAQAPAGDGGGGTETGGGSNVGNGGSGIVCRTGNEITRIELFDFYEAKILRGWEPSLAFTPDQSKTVFEQALDTAQHIVDTRWKSIDPVMATYLNERLKSLPSEVIFVDQPMPLQDDVAAVINAPTGCRREQLVIASEPYLAQRRYTVRKNYFEHPNFSNLDRAGLILHELLYRLTSSNGATTSRGVRYINAVLFADQQSETLTPLKHYFEVMKEAEFPWGGAHGVPVYLRTLNMSFRDIGGNDLASGLVVPGAPADTVFGPQKIACATWFDANGKVTRTTPSTLSEYGANIPGIGVVTGHGLDFFLPDYTYLYTHVGDSVAWEMPFETIENACQHFNPYKIGTEIQNGVTTVEIPYIDVALPVHFETPIYSADAKVDVDMEFTWKDNENAKYGGHGEGMLTFASGDKCQLEGASYVSSHGLPHGIIGSRCSARLVPGGPWVKILGHFGVYVGFFGHGHEEQYIFSLDPHSDTTYAHVAGAEIVNLKLKAANIVGFDDHGRLIHGHLGADAMICASDGEPRLYQEDQAVDFDERGCVSAVY